MKDFQGFDLFESLKTTKNRVVTFFFALTKSIFAITDFICIKSPRYFGVIHPLLVNFSEELELNCEKNISQNVILRHK